MRLLILSLFFCAAARAETHLQICAEELAIKGEVLEASQVPVFMTLYDPPGVPLEMADLRRYEGVQYKEALRRAAAQHLIIPLQSGVTSEMGLINQMREAYQRGFEVSVDNNPIDYEDPDSLDPMCHQEWGAKELYTTVIFKELLTKLPKNEFTDEWCSYAPRQMSVRILSSCDRADHDSLQDSFGIAYRVNIYALSFGARLQAFVAQLGMPLKDTGPLHESDYTLASTSSKAALKKLNEFVITMQEETGWMEGLLHGTIPIEEGDLEVERARAEKGRALALLDSAKLPKLHHDLLRTLLYFDEEFQFKLDVNFPSYLDELQALLNFEEENPRK